MKKSLNFLLVFCLLAGCSKSENAAFRQTGANAPSIEQKDERNHDHHAKHGKHGLLMFAEYTEWTCHRF